MTYWHNFVIWRNIIMNEFMNITKALADETRVRLLMALRGGELCVCQMTELLGLAPSTVSKHLSIMHQAGLVYSRKEERWVYYRLPGSKMAPMARQALAWASQCIGLEERITADARRLRKILTVNPVELCKRVCSK